MDVPYIKRTKNITGAGPAIGGLVFSRWAHADRIASAAAFFAKNTGLNPFAATAIALGHDHRFPYAHLSERPLKNKLTTNFGEATVRALGEWNARLGTYGNDLILAGTSRSCSSLKTSEGRLVAVLDRAVGMLEDTLIMGSILINRKVLEPSQVDNRFTTLYGIQPDSYASIFQLTSTILSSSEDPVNDLKKLMLPHLEYFVNNHTVKDSNGHVFSMSESAWELLNGYRNDFVTPEIHSRTDRMAGVARAARAVSLLYHQFLLETGDADKALDRLLILSEVDVQTMVDQMLPEGEAPEAYKPRSIHYMRDPGSDHFVQVNAFELFLMEFARLAFVEGTPSTKANDTRFKTALQKLVKALEGNQTAVDYLRNQAGWDIKPGEEDQLREILGVSAPGRTLLELLWPSPPTPLTNSLLYLLTGNPWLGLAGVVFLEIPVLLFLGPLVGWLPVLSIFSLPHVWIEARQHPERPLWRHLGSFVVHLAAASPYAFIGTPGLQDLSTLLAAGWHLVYDGLLMVWDQNRLATEEKERIASEAEANRRALGWSVDDLSVSVENSDVNSLEGRAALIRSTASRLEEKPDFAEAWAGPVDTVVFAHQVTLDEVPDLEKWINQIPSQRGEKTVQILLLPAVNDPRLETALENVSRGRQHVWVPPHTFSTSGVRVASEPFARWREGKGALVWVVTRADGAVPVTGEGPLSDELSRLLSLLRAAPPLAQVGIGILDKIARAFQTAA